MGIYEPTSGLYYHQASGYYFDAERSLYYDGNLGTWYRWDSEKEEYAVYSTAPEEEVAAHVEQRAERAGLGAAAAHAAPQTGLEKKRSELWMKTQKRFASTALLEDPNKADEDDQLMPPPLPPASSS